MSYKCRNLYSCKIHQGFRLIVCNSGRVQQPAENAFPADSALLSNAPANHTHEYRHRCLYSHVSKNVVQPSDICVQTLASPHCSCHCSRCSSACRKISVAQTTMYIAESHKCRNYNLNHKHSLASILIYSVSIKLKTSLKSYA